MDVAAPLEPFADPRNRMVDSQVRPNKVSDPRILDAMRQLLFNAEGFWPLWIEVSLLAGLSVLFIFLAKWFLAYLERLSQEEGRLTVKWQ